MKKILLSVMWIGLAMSGYSVESRLSGATSYFESADLNTSAKEMPMSPYKDGKIVFFRNDTAYMFASNADNGIDRAEICKELTGLGIEGTFAYDEKLNTLYFSKPTQGEKNDLYVANWKGDKWDVVGQMPIKGVAKQRMEYKNSSLLISRYAQVVRGASGFYNPSLGEDGKRVYFSGEFKAGKGGRDLWYTDLEEDGKWSRPRLVSEENSSISNEDYPLVVGDTLLYFASDRPGGIGGLDIYYAKKQKRDTTWGDAKILSENVNSTANDYNVVFGKQEGTACFLSNRAGGHGEDDIYASLSLHVQPDVELTIDATLVEPKGFNWVFFFFELNKYDMKPEYEVQLNEVLSAMDEYPGAKFEISGHTDSRGEDNYNMKLSANRANFVKNLLIKRGANANSLIAVGKGETEPIVKDAQTEPEHEQNRRVEISIVEQ